MRRGVTIAAGGILLLALSAGLMAARSSPAQPSTLQATIQSLQVKTGDLDLITGVGLALRIVHLRVAPDARVESAGATTKLADLRPGDIVRVEYRVTAEGNVAEKIEKVGQLIAGPGGVR